MARSRSDSWRIAWRLRDSGVYWGGTEIQRCEWYFLLERLYWDGQLATEDAKGRLKMGLGPAVWPGAVLQGGLGRVGDGHQDFTGGAFHDDSVGSSGVG